MPFDAASFGSAGGATSLTIAHTCGSADGRVLMAACHGADSTFTATYAGASMAELYDGNPGTPFRNIAVYRLAAPAVGVNNLVFTTGAVNDLAGCGHSRTGISQSAPDDGAVVSTGTSTTPSGTVTSQVGDEVVDFVAVNTDANATPGGGQTERVDYADVGQFTAIYSSEKVGASSVTMTWTLGGSDAWTQAVVNLNIGGGVATAARSRAFPRGPWRART